MMARPSANLSAPDRAQIIFHISKLLDLSNDLERNTDDARFADRGGKIHYIFDETVFEMFFRPIDRRMAIATFYRTQYSDTDLRARWKNFEAQAALIGSEYLLSHALPGIDDDRSIYLSHQHYLELALRVDTAIRYYGDKARQNLAELRREIESKNQLLARFRGDADDRSMRSAELDEDLINDLMAMPAHEKLDPYRSPFSLTRQAVRLAAQSRFCEPLDQLSRIVSERISNRIRILTEKYRPDAEDMKHLENQSRIWFFRLKQEAMKSRYHGTRKDGSFWSDAQSLAIVQWLVSRYSTSLNRFVLVTHDDLLYNTYRAWDAQLPTTAKEFKQPFFMRRALQYSPLINLSQARSDLFEHSDTFKAMSRSLFDTISQAVEISLLPLYNPVLTPEYSGDSLRALYRSRDYLSLHLRDYPLLGRAREREARIVDFIDKLSADWLMECVQSMNEISGTWKTAERIAIGSYKNYVMARIEDDARFVPVQFDELVDRANANAVTEYLNVAIDELFQKSGQVWLPLARDFILSARQFLIEKRKAREGHVTRAPLTAWCQLTNGMDVMDFIEALVMAADNGESLWKEIEDRHEDIFIVAACLAIDSRDWINAERYAALAVRSARTGVNRAGGYTRFEKDAQFIRALSIRFLLGQIDGHMSSDSALEYAKDSFYKAMGVYKRAEDILLELIEAHGKYLSEPWHRVRFIRACSELAALQLFCFASVNLGVYDAPPELAQRVFDGEGMLAEAFGRMQTCVNLGDRYKQKPAEIKRLEQQYIFNLSCYEILRYVFRRSEDFEPDADMLAVRDRVNEIYHSLNKTLSPIVELSRAAFLLLYDRSPDNLGHMSRFEEDQFVGELSLDRRLAAKIISTFDAKANIAH